MKVKVVNLTPHAVSVWGNREKPMVFEPDRTRPVPRVAVTRECVGNLQFEAGGICFVYENVYGEVEGLPPQEDDTVFIVSSMVLERALDRLDLVAPGELVRNEAGVVTGCKGLVRQTIDWSTIDRR